MVSRGYGSVGTSEYQLRKWGPLPEKWRQLQENVLWQAFPHHSLSRKRADDRWNATHGETNMTIYSFGWANWSADLFPGCTQLYPLIPSYYQGKSPIQLPKIGSAKGFVCWFSDHLGIIAGCKTKTPVLMEPLKYSGNIVQTKNVMSWILVFFFFSIQQKDFNVNFPYDATSVWHILFTDSLKSWDFLGLKWSLVWGHGFSIRGQRGDGLFHGKSQGTDDDWGVPLWRNDETETHSKKKRKDTVQPPWNQHRHGMTWTNTGIYIGHDLTISPNVVHDWCT